MWFIFRFIVALYICKIKPTKHLLEWVYDQHRVMPWDLDANIHMNNVKYLKYLERGRVEHMIHTPWLQVMHRNHAKALIANTEISYVRELRAWQTFTVETRVNSWDEKYIYVEQLFTDKDTIFTTALIRMAVVDTRQGGRVSPRALFAKMFPDLQPPEMPASASLFNQLIQAQRLETQQRSSQPKNRTDQDKQVPNP